MEASVPVLEERLRTLDARTRSTHDSLSKVRDGVAAQEVKTALLEASIVEMRSDMEDLKKSNNRVVGALVTLSLSTVGSAIYIAVSLGSHP